MPGNKTFTATTLTAADVNAYLRGGNVMAHASKTADQTFTTIADVTDLSITFTAIAGRLYEVTASAQILSSVANDIAYLIIADGSNNNLQVGAVLCPSTTYGMSIDVRLLIGYVSGGSKTFKVRCGRAAGSGTLTLAAAATYPAHISAVDIGTS